jgi:hypothetical protein
MDEELKKCASEIFATFKKYRLRPEEIDEVLDILSRSHTIMKEKYTMRDDS